MTEAANQRQAPMPRSVISFVTSLAVAATALAFVNLDIAPQRSPAWLALVPFFLLLVLAERLDVRFKTSGHVESVNLFEAALAPMLFAFPGAAVAGVVTVAWLTAGVMRRNHPTKALFNAASWALASGIAASILSLSHVQSGVTIHGITILMLTMIVVGVVNQTCLTTVMALAQRRHITEVVKNLSPVIVPGWVIGWGLNTLVGLLFVFAYEASSLAVLLFFVPLGVLYAAYKGYAGTESDRMRLGGLHRASKLLSTSGDADGSVADFLAEVSRCFEAGAAELILVVEDGIELHRVRHGRRETYVKEMDESGVHGLAAILLAQDSTVRFSSEGDGLAARALRQAGWRDCLMSPMPGDQIVPGVLVVFDQNGIEGFEEGERAVLEALARETGSSFEKGRLFDAVIQERERFSKILDATSDGVLTLTSHGVVRTWNPGWEQITKWPATAAVGRVISETIGMFDGDGREVVLADWTTGIDHLPSEIQIFDRDGARHWLECSYRIERLANSSNRVLVVVAQDTTDERQVEQLKVDVDRLVELEAAQRAKVLQLQESLQPIVPDVQEAEFGVYYLPSDTTAPTGGDFYDWQTLPSGDVHIAVVDVLGSGVEATNDALAVIHTLRTLAFQGVPVERLVRETDHLLATLDAELVATVICVRYDPSTGFARLAGGGHPPPLLVRAGGAVTEIAAPGVPVGWPDAGSDRAVDIHLNPSDTLLLYTDGLVEAQRDILLGLDALARTAEQTRDLPADELARELVQRSLEGAARRDDSLALVLRHRGSEQNSNSDIYSFRGSPSVERVSLVRRELREWMSDHNVINVLSDDLVVVVSELVTNAVRSAVSYIEVRAEVANEGVVLEIIDDGSGFDHALITSVEPDMDDESGRGLFIVQSLVDEFDVDASGRECRVRVFKRAPQANAHVIAPSASDLMPS